MNRFQFIANLGRDAEVRTLDTGVMTISFPAAITEKWTDRNGEKKEQTTWVNVTIWKQPGQSTALAGYLKKGQKVLVEGKPTARAYVSRDGVSAASLEVRADNVELLGGMPAQGQPQPQAPQQQQQQQQQRPAPQPQHRPHPAPPPAQWPDGPLGDDDLPF